MENLFKSCIACHKTPFSCLCRPILRRTTVSYMSIPIKPTKTDILNQYNNFQSKRKTTGLQKK